MSKPKVSIIILNYNGLNFLKECLPTVKQQTYENIEIIVTDNNSNDTSQDYIKSLDEVTLIRNKDNFGYSKANNIAAKKATGEFLFFLNNDTKLFKDTIENLVECYKNNTLVTPTQIIENAESKFEYTGNGMDVFGYPYGVLKDRQKVFYVDGAAIFIKKKDFFEIGKFDEELFIFQEDVDLSWRAQIQGYKIITCKKAKLYHFSGGVVPGGAYKNGTYRSSYFRRYLNEKNVLRNMIKNYSLFMLLIFLPLLVIIHSIEIIILLFLKQTKVIRCYVDAYIWNIKNIKNTLRYRSLIQKKRKVSDFYLIKKMYFKYSKYTAYKRIKQLPTFE